MGEGAKQMVEGAGRERHREEVAEGLRGDIERAYMNPRVVGRTKSTEK